MNNLLFKRQLFFESHVPIFQIGAGQQFRLELLL